MVCSVTGDPCGEGRGVCENTTCVCEPGWVSQCDFLWYNECQVHFATTKALWLTNSMLWFAVVGGSVYALCRLERRTKEALQSELGILLATIVGGMCYVIVGILQMSASYPGERSAGIDPLTTGFLACPNFLLWLFICLNPLSKSQTGVASLALNRVRRARNLYVKAIPLLVFTGFTASILPIIILYTKEQHGFALLSTFFILEGFEASALGALTAISFWMMFKDFSKTLNTSTRDLPPSHRAQVEKIAKSAKKLVLVPTLAALILGPFFFACASDALIRKAWITLPVSASIGGLWMFRYINRSAKASEIVRAREQEQSSHHVKPTTDIETKNSSGNDKPATDSHSSSLSSTTNKSKPSRHPRKTFRLKGFKSKPMQLMSQVTEGNSEGTVRFTQVDGVDIANSNSSRFSRPVTTSVRLEVETSPRPGHKSVSSVQATLWEVDIAAEGQSS